MNALDSFSKLCENYRGHDQALSLLGYGCTMLAGLGDRRSTACAIASSSKDAASPTGAVKLRAVATQISNARVILRLLDDASMFKYTLSYGLGKQEKSVVLRVLTVVGNLASHVYYICEHIAWLCDNKLIGAVSSSAYWLVSLLAWLVSLLTSIVW